MTFNSVQIAANTLQIRSVISVHACREDNILSLPLLSTVIKRANIDKRGLSLKTLYCGLTNQSNQNLMHDLLQIRFKFLSVYYLI